MINFINKTVEILAHILYNKGQANQEGLLAFYTIIEQEDKNMSLKDFDYKKGGIFAAGVLFGTAGIKVLSSKDAKKLYTNCTAAVLRAKECVMKTATTIQENAEDIYAEAQQINEDRAAQAAKEYDGEAEAAETATEE